MAQKDKPIRKLAGGEDFDGLERAEPSLPASWYYDREQYQRELERIFYRDWLYVCHASALAEPRRFRRFDVGRQSIVLLRDDSGVLQGFFNTCFTVGGFGNVVNGFVQA